MFWLPLLDSCVANIVNLHINNNNYIYCQQVILAYHYGKLAANMHCDSPRQDIDALRDGRMRIVTDHIPFGRTFVAVNSISLVGSNGHVLLHGHYKPKVKPKHSFR